MAPNDKIPSPKDAKNPSASKVVDEANKSKPWAEYWPPTGENVVSRDSDSGGVGAAPGPTNRAVDGATVMRLDEKEELKK